MNQPVLFVGIGCVIAAVVGGGLSLANLKVPVVSSIPRQLLLGVTGFVLVGASFLLPGSGDDQGGGGGGGDGPRPGGSAEITLSDGSAPRGAALTVSGSGLSPAELVEIRLHVTSVATVTADSEGRFTQRVTVPESAPPPGFPTSVSATGHSSLETATAPFTVAGRTGGGSGSPGASTDCISDASTPEITLSRGTAPRGAAITVSGSGFCAGEVVEIRVHVTSVGTATADGTGGFTQRVTVPPSAPPPGFPTSVSATGHSSSKTATAPFSTS